MASLPAVILLRDPPDTDHPPWICCNPQARSPQPPAPILSKLQEHIATETNKPPMSRKIAITLTFISRSPSSSSFVRLQLLLLASALFPILRLGTVCLKEPFPAVCALVTDSPSASSPSAAAVAASNPSGAGGLDPGVPTSAKPSPCSERNQRGATHLPNCLPRWKHTM